MPNTSQRATSIFTHSYLLQLIRQHSQKAMKICLISKISPYGQLEYSVTGSSSRISRDWQNVGAIPTS